MISPQECSSIDQIRSEIDRIDRAIVEVLAERREYVEAIMRFKRNAEDVRASDRQARMISLRRRWAEEMDLDPALVERIFRTMIDHFVAKEMKILSRREEP